MGAVVHSICIPVAELNNRGEGGRIEKGMQEQQGLNTEKTYTSYVVPKPMDNSDGAGLGLSVVPNFPPAGLM